MTTILFYVLIFVEVVCSLLLIGVILLQKSKGQGVGLAFGAGMGESLFGAQMGNVLTKTTIILSVIFLVNTTVISLLPVGKERASAVDAPPILPEAPVTPSTSGQPVPGGPAGGPGPGPETSLPVVEETVPIPVGDGPSGPAAEPEPSPPGGEADVPEAATEDPGPAE